MSNELDCRTMKSTELASLYLERIAEKQETEAGRQDLAQHADIYAKNMIMCRRILTTCLRADLKLAPDKRLPKQDLPAN